MPASRSILNILAVSFIFSSCAHSEMLTVDGVEVYKAIWEKTTQELGQRAAFDFACPVESLTYRLFKVTSISPTEVGVKGCGKQGVYVRVIGSGTVGPWALTAAAESAGDSASGTNDPGVEADQHARDSAGGS
jgi:hypothetical protein